MGAVHDNSVMDQKVATASVDHWKACFSSMSMVASFAMSANPTMNA
jgi:hypothetical protein